MSWHEDTFQIAGRRLIRVSARENEVVLLEHRIGTTIPASLRELLASDAWPDFLRTFSNNDEPLEVSHMGKAIARWPAYDAVSSGFLPFMFENQGVCTWAVPLNSGDDPPVVVEIDSGDPPIWQTAAESLSLWLRCQVEDLNLLHRAMFATQGEPLTESMKKSLSDAFSVGPTTFAWPAGEVIRLRNDFGSLLLWNGDDQCDWWIAPDDDRKTVAMLDLLPPLPNLPG